MSKRALVRTAAVVLCMLGGACHSGSQPEDASARSANGLPNGPGEGLPPGSGQAASPSTTRPSGAPAGGGSTGPSGKKAPSGASASGGSGSGSTAGGSTAGGTSGGGAGTPEPDAFDRRAHLPDGTAQVASGANGRVSWRLYAYRSDRQQTCLHFAVQSNSGGGAAGTCEQKPPLDRSMSESSDGRFIYGLTAGSVVRVRLEHADGSAETFNAGAASGYAEHFYAGEVRSVAPLTRLVAYDASGTVVAERKDMDTLNYKT